MSKVSTIVEALICVAVLGGACFGGVKILDSKSSISENSVVIDNSSNVQEGAETTITEESGIKYRNVQVNNSVDLYSGNLVSITVDTYADYDYNSLELSNIEQNKTAGYSVSNSEDTISSNALESLNTMMTDYVTDTGNTTAIVSMAYVPMESLDDILNCDHLSGLSFDLGSYDGSTVTDYDGTGDFQWISDRADKYGFIQRYPSDKVQYTGIDEPRHFRYVGLPHSQFMKENSLCLEEYIATVKLYSYDNPLSITTFNGRTYDVYYVSVTDDDVTNVPVLIDKEYNISGDNKEGYIVAVKVSG